MVYVLSDIHGNERRFYSILEQINLQREDTLYILGDVIDRHPGGIRILRKIMSMDNVKMLLGNHEYMMLQALGYPYTPSDSIDNQSEADALSLWHYNGGKVTHNYWKRIRKSIRSDIIQYLQNLPLNIDVEVLGTHYKLVHGAPIDEYTQTCQYPTPAYFAVWKRRKDLDYSYRTDTVVFGHTPTSHYQNCIPMEMYRGEHCIGIDCGSGYPEGGYYGAIGRLACLRLDDGKVFYSSEMSVQSQIS